MHKFFRPIVPLTLFLLALLGTAPYAQAQAPKPVPTAEAPPLPEVPAGVKTDETPASPERVRERIRAAREHLRVLKRELRDAKRSQNQDRLNIDVELDDDDMENGREIVRFGSNYELKEGESVKSIVVMGGNIDVHGTVTRDLVVVGGTIILHSKAAVQHDAIVVGGAIEAKGGAVVHGDTVVVGGTLRTEDPGALKKSQVVLSNHWAGLLAGLGGLFAWVKFINIFSILTLFLLGGFLYIRFTDAASEKVFQALKGGLVRAGITGLVAWLLFPLVALLLVVSIVGIPVLVFVGMALVVFSGAGFASLCELLGARLWKFRRRRLRDFVVGALLLLLVFQIPLLGFMAKLVAWAAGLGGVLLAFHRRRHWHGSVNGLDPAVSRP